MQPEQSSVVTHRIGTQAVFSRNWHRWLSEAAEIGGRDSSQRVTFRSEARWVGARDAVAERGPIPVYFAVNREGDPDGATPLVEYEATLVAVRVDPTRADAETRELLANVLPGTRDEGDRGLWGRTLYAVTGCRKLKRPFPITELRKSRQRDEPLDANYTRGYALVRART